MKIVFLDAKTIGDDIDLSGYDALGEVVKYGFSTPEEARERTKDADVIVLNKVVINEQSIGEAEHLKLVCVTATGTNNLDKEYLDQRGIAWRNVAGYSTETVAQHTFALLFYLLEKLHYYDEYVKSGAYSAQDRFSNFDQPFYELEGKTWGIVGMGNIGRRAAAIATAFGCKVIFYSITGKSTCTDYPQVDKDTLLKESDFLSLHCPLSDLSRNFIDKEALRKMKKTAILINVARGPVVNNADLYEALVAGEIQAAGLDVLEKEPLELSNPLSQLKDSNKLIITPHLAWASVEARTRCVQGVYENIKAFMRGENRNVVNL